MRYMLDTNLCIYAMKNKPEQVRQRFDLRHYQLCISSVTLMELAVGAQKSQSPQKAFFALKAFVQALSVVEYDDRAGLDTANIKATLKKQGVPVGADDVMIAGHARSLGLVVVTILNSYQNHTAKPFAPSLPVGGFSLWAGKLTLSKKPLSGFE